ncbi:MAG: ChaN family lipoprotein [Myxococcota bacterium]
MRPLGGPALPQAQLLERLAERPIVYVGELHDQKKHHDIQLRILRGLRERGATVALGMEMFHAEQQPDLDRWVAGELEEADFLEAVNWTETWGFDFELYRPLLDYARLHDVPVLALNVRRSLSRAVAESGVDGLSDELRAELPEMDLEVEAHRTRFMAAMKEMGADKHPGMDLEKFYQAQVLWDEAMARAVAATMTADDSPEYMVVLAGRAHVEHALGIPQRAARRGAEPFWIVLPVAAEGAEASAPGRADFLWLTGRP